LLDPSHLLSSLQDFPFEVFEPWTSKSFVYELSEIVGDTATANTPGGVAGGSAGARRE